MFKSKLHNCSQLTLFYWNTLEGSSKKNAKTEQNHKIFYKEFVSTFYTIQAFYDYHIGKCKLGFQTAEVVTRPLRWT